MAGSSVFCAGSAFTAWKLGDHNAGVRLRLMCRPWHRSRPTSALRQCDRHCVRESGFGFGLGLKCLTNGAQCGGVLDVNRVGIVRFETRRELVGLVEDLSDSAGHEHHLRYLPGRHRVHDDRPFVRRQDTDLQEVAGVVRSDEHHEAFVEVFDTDRVVERMDDGVIAHTVLTGARSRLRLGPQSVLDQSSGGRESARASDNQRKAKAQVGCGF